jgi:hypothetical protein
LDILIKLIQVLLFLIFLATIKIVLRTNPFLALAVLIAFGVLVVGWMTFGKKDKL